MSMIINHGKSKRLIYLFIALFLAFSAAGDKLQRRAFRANRKKIHQTGSFSRSRIHSTATRISFLVEPSLDHYGPVRHHRRNPLGLVLFPPPRRQSLRSGLVRSNHYRMDHRNSLAVFPEGSGNSGKISRHIYNLLQRKKAGNPRSRNH